MSEEKKLSETENLDTFLDDLKNDLKVLDELIELYDAEEEGYAVVAEHVMLAEMEIQEVVEEFKEETKKLFLEQGVDVSDLDNLN